jgi:MTH538 TIR-like domain (DUF1863)
MARNVFFSFHYKHVWRVNQIRSIPNIVGTAAAGFKDASLWEEAKSKGEATITKLIDNALLNTSVTVVCVTFNVVNRKYINYEIDESLARGNGLVAVQIHHLVGQDKQTSDPGSIPPKIAASGFKAYKYTSSDDLAKWIEEAAKIAGR